MDELTELVPEPSRAPDDRIDIHDFDQSLAIIREIMAYRARPSSQEALAKAAAKRQRKAARLAQQLGG